MVKQHVSIKVKTAHIACLLFLICVYCFTAATCEVNEEIDTSCRLMESGVANKSLASRQEHDERRLRLRQQVAPSSVI